MKNKEQQNEENEAENDHHEDVDLATNISLRSPLEAYGGGSDSTPHQLASNVAKGSSKDKSPNRSNFNRFLQDMQKWKQKRETKLGKLKAKNNQLEK